MIAKGFIPFSGAKVFAIMETPRKRPAGQVGSAGQVGGDDPE